MFFTKHCFETNNKSDRSETYFIKVRLKKKTWQVESVEHIEQYDIKFGDKIRNSKQRGRKTLVDLLFSWS